MDKETLLRHILAEMPKNPPSPPNGVRVIEMLVFTRVQMLDVTGPLQVFASANDLVAETAAEEGKAPPDELRVVAQGGAAVAASAGVELIANPLPPPGTSLDTLIVPGGPGVEAAVADPVLVEWVRELAKQARRVAS